MLTMDDIIRDPHPTLRLVAKEVPMPPSDEDKAVLKACSNISLRARIMKLPKKKG